MEIGLSAIEMLSVDDLRVNCTDVCRELLLPTHPVTLDCGSEHPCTCVCESHFTFPSSLVSYFYIFNSILGCIK